MSDEMNAGINKQRYKLCLCGATYKVVPVKS